MESMSKTTEHTWGASLTVTAGVEATAGTGDSSPVKAETKVSVQAALTGSYGGSIATESTYETTNTFAEGQSESITATIGEHDEAFGQYRYALFGSTDVYYEVEIDASTRAVKKAEIIQCARGDTLAWGIDFTPQGQTTEFGKTGGGDNFAIPDIDFKTIDAPTKEGEMPPAPLVTGWTGTKTKELRINDTMYDAYLISRFYHDSFTSNFNFSRLQSEGYTTMDVKVVFQVKPIDDGWVNVYVFSGTMDRELDYTYEKIDPPELQWSSQTYQFFVPLTSFTSNDLKILWTASGNGSDDYQLGARTITVTASK
jgi:hypothetical protein